MKGSVYRCSEVTQICLRFPRSLVAGLFERFSYPVRVANICRRQVFVEQIHPVVANFKLAHPL